MKNIKSFILTAVLVSSALIQGCGSEPELTQSERVDALLTEGTWKIQTVVIDGVDKTAVMFTGLQLTFGEGTFTSVNGGLVWPASGTRTFTDEDAVAFTRGDGVVVEIVEITEAKLVVSLDWATTTFGAGRQSSLRGKHTFTFNK